MIKKSKNSKQLDDKVSTIKTLDISSYVNIEYGSIQKNYPYSVFIVFRGWSTIRKDMGDEDYQKASKQLNKSIRQYLYNVLDDKLFYKDKTIVINDFSASVMAIGKETFINLEITIFQKKCLPFTDNELMSTIVTIAEDIDVMFRFDKVFKFYKEKESENYNRRNTKI